VTAAGDETQPRVPTLRSVGLVGDVAVVRGFGTYFLGEALAESGLLRRELETLLARSAVSPEGRAEVRRVCAALSAAGALWRLGESDGFRGSGNGGGEFARGRANSNGEGSFYSREVGPLLGVTERQVRGLAAAGRLPARRDLRGRWVFERADIMEERRRRGLKWRAG